LAEPSEQKPTTRNDWKIIPMPREQGLLYANLNYSDAEVEILRQGFYPHHPDDKWFIYFQKNNMHFHIRDSGYCVFILEFIADREDGYSAYYAKVNRKSTQYKYISERLDMCLLSAVIDYLLGRTDTMLDCSCPRGK